MKLTGDFIKDMEAIEEEYTARACFYARRVFAGQDDNGKLLSAKQIENATQYQNKYQKCSERMKKILKYIDNMPNEE